MAWRRSGAKAGGVSPHGAGAVGGLGDRRPTQTLVGEWYHVGLSISENAKKSSAIKLHFFGNKMQRAPVHPAAGEGAPEKNKWGFYLQVQHCAGDLCACSTLGACLLFHES